MRLAPMQWVWLAGAVLYFAALLLDIVGAWDVPGPVLVVVPLVLMGLSLVFGPSLKDLKRAGRRG